MDRVECGEPTGVPIVCGRDGEIGTVVVAHMVARRDGGSDTCVRANPRRDHGDSGCVPGVSYVAPDGIRARGNGICHILGRNNCVFCGNRWFGAKRHQTCDRLFNLFAAGIHVCGRGCGRLFGCDVPPIHARVFQGDVVPWCGIRDPRDASRTGYAQLRRSA